ncbi:MAG: hypothetical protein HY887_06535 [Deltaproteobacteria bacterium]|nr:hypothetical protein [Deltaproteobacteria bacterium]
MRQAVVETAKRNGFKAVEGKVTVKELLNADEAFFAGSGLQPHLSKISF